MLDSPAPTPPDVQSKPNNSRQTYTVCAANLTEEQAGKLAASKGYRYKTRKPGLRVLPARIPCDAASTRPTAATSAYATTSGTTEYWTCCLATDNGQFYKKCKAALMIFKPMAPELADKCFLAFGECQHDHSDGNVANDPEQGWPLRYERMLLGYISECPFMGARQLALWLLEDLAAIDLDNFGQCRHPARLGQCRNPKSAYYPGNKPDVVGFLTTAIQRARETGGSLPYVQTNARPDPDIRPFVPCIVCAPPSFPDR